MPANDSRDLYLDLMKRCLTDRIYMDDALAHFAPYREKPDTPAWKRTAIDRLITLLKGYDLRLVERHTVPWRPDYADLPLEKAKELREQEDYYAARAHTLLNTARLDNIQHCVETVLREGVPGDLAETGVWRGGACIFMRAILKAYADTTRRVWLADSFQGLPAPNATAYAADSGDEHHKWADYFAVSRAQVEQNFRRYDLLDEQVRFLEGWFKDTLGNAPIDRLAVFRLDGDMYESTIQALEGLYDKVSPGGFIIVDDYWLPACAKAIHDFRDRREVRDEILNIDGRGAYWRKS